MEREIKNFVEKYKNTNDYEKFLCDAKEIIDEEYQNMQNEKTEHEIKKDLEQFLEKNNYKKEQIEEFNQITIKINKKDSHDNQADYFLDCFHMCDLHFQNKIFSVAIQLYGDKSLCEPSFRYCSLEKNGEKIYMQLDDKKAFIKLYKHMKIKHTDIYDFVSFITRVFKYCYKNTDNIYLSCYENCDSD
jgi:hypothetical protein